MKYTLALIAALGLSASAFAAGDKPAADGKEPPMGKHSGMQHGPMADADTNHDSFISKEEWEAKGDKMFKEMDANGDGKLSKEEMRAHHEAMAKKWKERREEMKEKFHGEKDKENTAQPVKN